jgi:tetratricopeptide (TPR) repeat protein
MKTRVAFHILAFFVGSALSFFCVPEVTAQQGDETSVPEIVSPSDSDSSTLPSEQTGESGMEEITESASEAFADESEPTTPAEEAFQRALEHEKKNELDEAIADCTEAIRSDPGNAMYLISRAEFYGEIREYDKASEDAAKVLETDPSNLRARLLRGKMLDRSGDPEKALIEFNTAVEQNPTSVQALSDRQNYFDRNNQHDKALADGNRIIQLEPQTLAGYLAQANSHAASGEYDQAMNYASGMIQRNSDSPIGYVTRATTRADRGDIEGAKKDLDRAVELSPDNPFALSARSVIYFETGEYEKSLADLDKAAALEPGEYSFKAQLADYLATCPDDRMRNGEKAAQLATEAFELAPNDPIVWLACAAAAVETGKLDEAIKWQERVTTSPTLPSNLRYENQQRLATYKAGTAYRQNIPPPNRELLTNKVKEADGAIKNHNYDRAIGVLSDAIAADPSDWVPYFGRGFVYSRQKNYDVALADLNVAIVLKPENLDSYEERGFVFRNLGQYDNALEDFRKVEEGDKNDKRSVRNNLAWLLATCPDDRIRDTGKAAEYVDDALQFHPDNASVWDTCAAVFAAMGDFEDAVEWEQAYLDRQDLSDDQRSGGEHRLILYKEHQPFRTEIERQTKPVIAEAAPTPPGK